MSDWRADVNASNMRRMNEDLAYLEAVVPAMRRLRVREFRGLILDPDPGDSSDTQHDAPTAPVTPPRRSATGRLVPRAGTVSSNDP